MVGRMPLTELEGLAVDPGPKCPKRYERAFKRSEPHWAHPEDIVDLADEIALRWFKRAIRFGDELRELDFLFALPDPRTA